MSVLASVKSWYRRRKVCAALRAELEPWWTRWAVTLALIAIIVFAILDNQDGAIISSCVFFGLMALYFLLILLRKMNFSLLELFAAALIGGTINGLLLSMPGMLGTPWVALSLALAVTAWILYGVVKGLVCAQVVQADGLSARLGWIAAAWWTSVAPGFLIAAVILFYFSDQKQFITPAWRWWAVPFLCFGGAGIVLKIVLGLRVRKHALAAVNAQKI
jgi:hypothetical protein